MKGVLTKRAQRWNAVLSGALLVVLVVLINTASRGLDWKRDVSEDQLFAPSPELKAHLGQLEDLLVVTAYFTASPERGAVQIAKSRMVAQLKDFADDAGKRMRLEFVDPNTSSAAKLEALRLGITPSTLPGMSGGGSYGYQEIWLGLSLKYRGRERAIPLAMPQTLEYAFASELFRLTRERMPRIGWYAPLESSGGTGWQAARATLAEAGALVPIEHLSVADAVPLDLDLLVVTGPRRLHPRAAFELDQFVQRGGRLVLALENREYPLDQSPAKEFPTGLESLLAAWGLELSPELIWDRQSLDIGVRRVEEGRDLGTVPMPYPYWLAIGPDELSKELPVTARLSGLGLRWCQELRTPRGLEAPAGLERLDLIQSSPDAYLAVAPASLVVDASLENTESARLAATQTPLRHTVGVSLSGAFPSPYTGKQAPAPQALFDAILGAGGWSGETTDEEVLADTGKGAVVVIADTDWMHRAGNQGWDPGARALLANLADWMLLEDDLLALRSRFPRSRPIVDFLAEEQAALGLTDLTDFVNLDEAETQTRAKDQAEAAATKRRVGAMLRALLGAVLLALVVFGLPGFLRRRRPSPYGAAPSDGGGR